MLNKRNFLGLFFLTFFTSLIIYLRYKVINAPIQPDRLSADMTIFKYGSFDVLFSENHRLIQIYRHAITNLLVKNFGINEFTYRAFSTVVCFTTMVFLYRFCLIQIGCLQATIGLFLFGLSHYSIWETIAPYYGNFYILGSFMTFYFLYKGLDKDKLSHWLLFGLWNFLNVTNVLLGGLFIPPVLVITVLILSFQISKEGCITEQTKKKIRHFVIAFSISIGAILVLYSLRGVNLIEQAFNLVFLKKDYGDMGSDVTLEHSASIINNFYNLINTAFFELNFTYYHDGAGAWISPIALWSYLCFFFLGLWSLYNKNKELFWTIIAIFLTPVFIFVFVLKISAGRYMSFILPFYLIVVACGFVNLVELSVKKISSIYLKEASIYVLAFVFFSWIIQPGFLFRDRIIDKQYLTEGMRAASDYLKENIKPKDIIINVTNSVELRGEIGDALGLHFYNFYLKQFFNQHLLDALPARKGRIGIWLILNKPINSKQYAPFYFPRNYSPKIIKKWEKTYLYYGEIDLPNDSIIEKDQVFATPFWSFLKARFLQVFSKAVLAERYYQKAIDFGFNLDRIYFNLGLLYMGLDFDKSMDNFRKAIKILEAGTNAKAADSYPVPHDYSKLKKNISDEKNNGIRYFNSEKNGQTFKKWFIEDLLTVNPIHYSKYYITPAKYLRYQYSRTGNYKYYKESMEYLEKGIRIYPYHEIVKQLKVFRDKSKQFLIKQKDPDFFPLNLLAIHEMYPPIKLDRSKND